ncbi:MAG: ComEC/Rec2 family competence protein [Firmicutes bacterium]|nr:ComEC/Rec2 family competence protein [Bacillota bacterium]
MEDNLRFENLPRRTVVLAAFAYVAGVAVQHAVADKAGMVIIATTVLMAMVLIRLLLIAKPEKVLRNGIIIVIICMISGIMMGYVDEHKVSKLYATDVNIEGRVVKAEVKEESKISLTVRECDTREKVLVTVEYKNEGEDVKGEVAGYTGAVIRVRGALEKPGVAGNPGGFDYSLYLRGMGIHNTMYVDVADVEFMDTPDGLWKMMHFLGKAKTCFEDMAFELMDQQTAGLLCGILFGDDGLMDETVQENFRHVGTGHLLAVSGLHVGMVYGIFYMLLGRPVSFWGNVPLMLMMLGYAAVSGFSPSVVRAVFMIFVNMVGRVTHRRYDFLTCIAFCGGMILLVRPTKLFSSGFQLSFLAVLSLSVILPRLERMVELPEMPDFETQKVTLVKYSRVVLKRRLISFALLTLSLQLGMTPVTAHIFHYISPAGIFANSPSIALAGIIVPLGMLMMPLAWALAALTGGIVAGGTTVGVLGTSFSSVGILLYKITAFAASMTEMIIRFLIYLNKMAEEVMGFRYVASPGIAVLVIYYAALFFFCSEAGERMIKDIRSGWRMGIKGESALAFMGLEMNPSKVATAVLVLVILTAGVGFQWTSGWKYNLAEAVFVDVGQGDCCHIKGDKGVHVLCDSGGSELKDVGTDTLIPYFLGNGIRKIDLAVISHLHTDHYKGLTTLKDGVKIGTLVVSEVYKDQVSQISQETGVPVEKIIFAKSGDVIDAGGGVTVKVLASMGADSGQDENEICLVYQVWYKGKSILFTGDIDSDYENQLSGIVGDNLKSDILKVAHHGSRYSSSDTFLTDVDPDFSIIQVGRNVYGHPTQEAIDRLESCGSEVYRNDIQGAVMVDMNPVLSPGSGNMNIYPVKE